MTRWNDITPEERRRWYWVETTVPGEERSFIKGGDRVPDVERNLRAWEYRQEAYCTLGGNLDKQPPWWDRQKNGTEVDWLNRLGAEGWELVSIEEHHHLYGHIGAVPHQTEGAIAARKWTFKREVSTR